MALTPGGGRLKPLHADEEDYYLGPGFGAFRPDSDDDMSSDDEIKQELRKIAGIDRNCVTDKCGRQRRRSEFESDMDDELDRSITEYASAHMQERKALPTSGSIEVIEDDGPPPLEATTSDEEMDDEDVVEKAVKQKEQKPPQGNKVSTPQKSILKKPTMENSPNKPKDKEEKMEEDDLTDNLIKKSAKEMEDGMNQEPPEFYDPEEDDENEKWVQDHRAKARGSMRDPAAKINTKSAAPEDGSDAVLSCPGCMSLLTRDCQRHEIYQDQYRAMFVENVEIDKAEALTVEKTGREKRKERHALRKQGIDPAETRVTSAAGDVFLAVKCRQCKTKVAVIDHEEVYHFFNVLSGYS